MPEILEHLCAPNTESIAERDRLFFVNLATRFTTVLADPDGKEHHEGAVRVLATLVGKLAPWPEDHLEILDELKTAETVQHVLLGYELLRLLNPHAEVRPYDYRFSKKEADRAALFLSRIVSNLGKDPSIQFQFLEQIIELVRTDFHQNKESFKRLGVILTQLYETVRTRNPAGGLAIATVISGAVSSNMKYQTDDLLFGFVTRIERAKQGVHKRKHSHFFNR